MTVQTYSKEYVEGLIAEKVILREGLCDIAKRAITDLNSTYEHMAADTLRKANFAQTSQKPCNHDADSKQRSFVVRSRQSVDPDELDEQRQEHNADCTCMDRMDSGKPFARHDWRCSCGYRAKQGVQRS